MAFIGEINEGTDGVGFSAHPKTTTKKSFHRALVI